MCKQKKTQTTGFDAVVCVLWYVMSDYCLIQAFLHVCLEELDGAFHLQSLCCCGNEDALACL